MTAPPLLLAAGLLFWGWLADALFLAIPMALLLEGSRWVTWRWDFSDRDFNRVMDLSNVLFAGAMAYLAARQGAEAILSVFVWLPAVLYLPMAAQAYSAQGGMRLSALFLSLRRAEARGLSEPSGRIDLSYPYFAACLIAAGVAQTEQPWFYPGIMLLVAWALWTVRPRRHSAAAWVALIALSAGLGYAGQAGLHHLQLALEDLALSWLTQSDADRTDPYRTHTAIGHIGELKLSERILMQVHIPEGGPMLLRQATYQTYRFNIWSAGAGKFREPLRGTATGDWVLGPGSGGHTVRIYTVLDDGRGVLALPGGTYRIEHLTVPVAKINPYGVFEVDEGPDFMAFEAHYLRVSNRDRPPEPADLKVPDTYLPALSKVIEEAGLTGLAPADAAGALEKFFQQKYRYTLYQRPGHHLGSSGAPPLTRFLLHTRAGHCEYFASAGALLLRSLGIPARYAVGYAVAEPASSPGWYLVRRSHAHAWVLAYLNGAWHDVDLTPSVWLNAEQEAAPWWSPLARLYAQAAFMITRWRWTPDEGEGHGIYPWLLGPLAGLLAWRLYRHKKVRRALSATSKVSVRRAGDGSPLYRLLPVLEALGPPRAAGEPLGRWIERLCAIRGEDIAPAMLQEALALHYRLRFDPGGLAPDEQARLEELARDWLMRMNSHLHSHLQDGGEAV